MKPDPTLEGPPADRLGRVHFIGIGGAGMSGIARILLARGLTVSGSDAKDSRALAEFGLADRRPVLLVTGGSLGAQRLNVTMGAAAPELAAAGVQVLHVSGRGKQVDPAGAPGYVVREYLDRMDLAFAAADFVVCRAGAGTVGEVTALGLPAAYVPLPIGNGEQRLNAQPVVDAGGALIVADSGCTPQWVADTLVPLLTDQGRLAAMGSAAAAFGIRDGDERLADLVERAARRAG